MTDVREIRRQIDTVDEQLLVLLNERARLALAVGKAKRGSGKQIYDPTREAEVLNRLTELNNGPLGKGAVEEVFAEIITVCREIQGQSA